MRSSRFSVARFPFLLWFCFDLRAKLRFDLKIASVLRNSETFLRSITIAKNARRLEIFRSTGVSRGRSPLLQREKTQSGLNVLAAFPIRRLCAGVHQSE